MLEAHRRYYLRSGDIDKARHILTSLTKMSVLIATRYWQMQRRMADSDDAAAGSDEIDVSGMSDDELAAAMGGETEEGAKRRGSAWPRIALQIKTLYQQVANSQQKCS